MSTAIAIFVKTPYLSPIKTRLAAGIGASEALHFYRLAAATGEVLSTCGPLLTPYWAVAEESVFTGEVWPEFPRLWQGTGTLGERLHRIHRELQSRHGAAFMIGADTPQLTSALLQQALAALQNPATAHVLGPARDGGFWLFGSKHPVPAAIWAAVSYSRNDTAETLRYALNGSGKLDCLPTLTDVDTANDLLILHAALQRTANPTTTQIELLDWLANRNSIPVADAHRI